MKLTLPLFCSGVFLLPLAAAVSFSNDNLIVNYVLNTGLGASDSFFCQLPDALTDQTVMACQVETPSGTVWTVEGGQVIDQLGFPVPGYTAVDNGQADRVCGLGIDAVAAVDLGKANVFSLIPFTLVICYYHPLNVLILQVTGNAASPCLLYTSPSPRD